MSDDGLVRSAVAIISCSARDNVEWGSRSFELWKLNPSLDPSVCIEIARRELYDFNFKQPEERNYESE